MLSDVLDISLESVDGIGLVVDHTNAAVSLVQRVSSDHIVSVVFLPGALVVSGAVVLDSVFVGVGSVALLCRVISLGLLHWSVHMVVVMVQVDVLLDRGQRVRQFLHQEDFLDGEEGSGHADNAKDEGDLKRKGIRWDLKWMHFCLVKIFK